MIKLCFLFAIVLAFTFSFEKTFSGTPGTCQFTLSGHTYWVLNAQWSPDGSKIVTAGSDDRTAIIWSTSTGQKLFTLAGHTGTVLDAQWNPDGSKILVVLHL